MPVRKLDALVIGYVLAALGGEAIEKALPDRLFASFDAIVEAALEPG